MRSLKTDYSEYEYGTGYRCRHWQNAGAGEQNSSDTTENTDNVNTQQTGNVDISAPSALLMEASTGQVIYEKDADSKRPPASVTKVMTLLLIFDALQEGKDTFRGRGDTSEYAGFYGWLPGILRTW